MRKYLLFQFQTHNFSFTFSFYSFPTLNTSRCLWLITIISEVCSTAQHCYELGNLSIFFQIWIQVLLKALHVVSHQCRSGMFRRPKRELIMDREFLYHIFFGLFCILGLVTHPFFYSILVSLRFTPWTLHTTKYLVCKGNLLTYCKTSWKF